MTRPPEEFEEELAATPAAHAMLLSLGWPVRRNGQAIFLVTTSGFCGLKVVGEVGERMLWTLRELDADGPVIAVPCPHPDYIFLADADVVLDTEATEQLGAALLQTPSAIPLPPSETPRGRLTWIVPPRLTKRWLPSLSTVRWALTMAG